MKSLTGAIKERVSQQNDINNEIISQQFVIQQTPFKDKLNRIKVVLRSGDSQKKLKHEVKKDEVVDNYNPNVTVKKLGSSIASLKSIRKSQYEWDSDVTSSIDEANPTSLK